MEHARLGWYHRISKAHRKKLGPVENVTDKSSRPFQVTSNVLQRDTGVSFILRWAVKFGKRCADWAAAIKAKQLEIHFY